MKRFAGWLLTITAILGWLLLLLIVIDITLFDSKYLIEVLIND